MNKTEADRRFNIFFIIKNSNKILLSFFLLLTLSCSSFMQKKNRSEKTFPEICFGIREKNTKLSIRPEKIPSDDLETLRKHFSNNAISIANDIGVTAQLLEYLSLGGKNKSHNRKLFIMKEVQERVTLSQMELSSMTAIADCERGRAMQLASHLDTLTNDETNTLAVRSILSTVVGTVLSAAIELTGGTAQLYKAADLFFAFLAGHFAYQSLNLDIKGYLGHKNNILRELKDKPEKPELFYASVWNFLNNENYPNEISERGEILRLWEQNKGTEEDEKLIFSEGGDYTSGQLYKLVSKYDSLKIRMAYMQLELRQLLEELEKKEKEIL
ncbi:MAG TPA: hypothetical protein PKN56_21530 [Leptospiraceae bacterium]|nr:hypothetical protein [Leptospiraceae bacterium]HMY67405.1 hypothetical protein [Leptospiraceae bacterium]HNF28313.1 hypothetical protein [Leptospiraceae bacterium]HNN06151.1 hypothetical protein [Leptospiraceae bacterium]